MKPIRNGFTLIETLIALAVFGVLTAMAVPSFKSWMANSQIRTAAEGLQNGLQLARNQALTMNTQVQFQLNTPSTNDWQISTALAPTTAIQTRINQGTTPQASIGPAVSGGATTITFNGLGRVVIPSTETTFSVSNPVGGTCQASSGTMRCLNVTVQTGGQIRICDPQLPSSNPQSC